MNLTLKFETELILTEYYPRANTTGVKDFWKENSFYPLSFKSVNKPFEYVKVLTFESCFVKSIS